MKDTRETMQVKGSAGRTRSIAFVGLAIAIMTVCAWVTIPLGPIPFTLQIFAFAFALLVLTPRQCIAALTGYLVLGAIGVPVFSGMRGGIGVLAGPTGGYLWGCLLGAALALVVLSAVRTRLEGQDRSSVKRLAGDGAGCLIFLAVVYVCGWLQFIVLTGTDPQAAFLMTIAPFIVIDLAKMAAAVLCARAVRAVVLQR